MEILQNRVNATPVEAVLFDFDGTLSLLRRNWHEVMIPMMVEKLSDTETTETREQLREVVEEFVMRLNGKQTIYQMIELAAQIERRGGKPFEPLQYKHEYHELLWRQVSQRVEQVQTERTTAESFHVPGALPLLEKLRASDVQLFLASGTDIGYVRDELRTLGLTEFFGERVYGALDDYKKFSKAMIIQQMIEESGIAADRIVGFGDGYVEIEEVAKAGGYAIGVASNEETRTGVNGWKRDRLIGAGAHAIVGDYRELDAITSLIGLG